MKIYHLHWCHLLRVCGFLIYLIFTTRKHSLRRLCFYRCVSVHRECVWFFLGGACMVFWGYAWFFGEGHVWFFWGCGFWGHAWFFWGCAWSFGGMHGFLGGHVWFWGACMFFCGGCAWLLGVHGCGGCGCQGVCVVVGGYVWLWGHVCGCGGHAWLQGVYIRNDEIRSMSGQYASYWNAYLCSV